MGSCVMTCRAEISIENLERLYAVRRALQDDLEAKKQSHSIQGSNMNMYERAKESKVKYRIDSPLEPCRGVSKFGDGLTFEKIYVTMVQNESP